MTRGVPEQERLDDLETIRVINYVRQEVAKGNKPAGTLTAGARPWDEDKYLQPVLLDDGLLQCDFEDLAGPRCCLLLYDPKGAYQNRRNVGLVFLVSNQPNQQSVLVG